MYKEPPTQHRFKKGTSGNPAGRPKKVKANIEFLEKFLQTFLLAMRHDELAEDKLNQIEGVLDKKNLPK